MSGTIVSALTQFIIAYEIGVMVPLFIDKGNEPERGYVTCKKVTYMVNVESLLKSR